MPATVRGAASPWLTGAGSDLLVVKVSVKFLYATTSEWTTDRLPVSRPDVLRGGNGH